MAKIKLDLDATDVITFERAVDIPTPDARGLKITFTFTYRDREAIATLFDGYKAKAEAAAQARASASDDESIVETVRTSLKNDVDVIMDIASGWNVDAPWSEEYVRKMCLRYAGAAMAIVSDYRVSLTQGRLGN